MVMVQLVIVVMAQDRCDLTIDANEKEARRGDERCVRVQATSLKTRGVAPLPTVQDARGGRCAHANHGNP